MFLSSKISMAGSSLLAAILFTACAGKEQKYEKSVTFPEGATMEQRVEMASNLVPAPKQLAWQDVR